MRALVVYESRYGNTKRVAEKVADALRSSFDVDVLPVGEDASRSLVDIDLLVVGGPTYAHGMSSERSRANSPSEVSKSTTGAGMGVREWVEGLPEHDGRAAAFDTRLHGPVFLTGAASKGIAKSLKSHGYQMIAPPESFIVDGTEGPLHEGELEHAQTWGSRLAQQVAD